MEEDHSYSQESSKQSLHNERTSNTENHSEEMDIPPLVSTDEETYSGEMETSAQPSNDKTNSEEVATPIQACSDNENSSEGIDTPIRDIIDYYDKNNDKNRHVHLISVIKSSSFNISSHNKMYLNSSDLLSTVNLNHSEKVNSSTSSVQRELSQMNQPVICSEDTNPHLTRNGLKASLKVSSGIKPFASNIVNKQVEPKTLLQNNINIHNKSPVHKCNLCSKRFSTIIGIQAHLREHKGMDPYVCEICDKIFRQRKTLEVHMRIHTGETPYHCEFCDRKFRSSRFLQIHRRTHTGEKPYLCKLCNKSFTTSANLLRHTKLHNGEKPYQCEKCGKRFSAKYNMEEHQTAHTGCICEICGKQFRHTNGLQRHQQMQHHMDPTNLSHMFSCDTCGESFLSKKSCHEHQIMHIGKKFVCEICGQAFTQNEALQEHHRLHANWNQSICDACEDLHVNQRMHSGEKASGCTVCGKAFSKLRHLLTNHIKSYNAFAGAYN